MPKEEQEKVNNRTKQDKETFLPLKQNATTNYIARFSTRNKKTEFKSNNNMYVAKYGQTKINISYDLDIYPDEVPDFYVGCQKLQRYIMCKFTEKGFTTNTISISVKEMLTTMGLADNKRNRVEIRQDLKTIQNTYVDFVEKRKKETVSGSFNIISGWYWNSGYIKVEIPQMLIDTLNKTNGFINYPVSNFQLSTRFILNFPINDRIAELVTKGNKTISCKKLYECAIEAGLKSYKDISERNIRKSFSSTIVKPIENALNAGSFYTWKYRKNEKHSTFNDWLDDYIEVTGEGIPLLKGDKNNKEVVLAMGF